MSDISTDAMMREAAMMDASNNHVWARKVRRLCIDRDKLQAQIAALPAASSEDVRAGNRVTYNDDGTLDEIVTDAGVHLEDLGGNRWFLGAARSDGTEVRVWIRGKVTLIEDDAQEAKT